MSETDLSQESAGSYVDQNFESNVLPAGATWLRWEPHIHGPGTVLNDQFKGSEAFNKYLDDLETVTPVLRAIGITDYYSSEVYELVANAKKSGRLPNCGLLFPNIELRLDVGTVSGSFVNIHLLVCPDEDDHLNKIYRFLSLLTFRAHGDNFHCTKADLIRLGKLTDTSIIDDRKALELGAIQFKVSRIQLQDEYQASDWAKTNIIIAVAGGSDGSGGLDRAADKTLREEIDKFADVIFASADNQREFWLGKKALSAEQIRSRYRSLKPCMHGSDAHRPEDVGAPKNNKFTWIKGVAQFDSLRQACIDPEGRAFVAPNPPLGANPSQTILEVHINDTSWCDTPKLNINPGLVAIIGARGSGKTALAEIIAAGCDAIGDGQVDGEMNKSFLNRAKPELAGSSVTLNWGSGRDTEVRSLYQLNLSPDKFPMARYLSQQFVDDLCSSDGVTDKLLKEVERIIFSSHDVNQREGTIDFAELLELKASRPRAARQQEEISLQDLCNRIGIELEKTKLVKETRSQIQTKDSLIQQYTQDRAKLVVTGSEERVKRLSDLATAADSVRNNVRYFSQREQSLLSIKDDVTNTRINKAPEELREMQGRHIQAGIQVVEWQSFLTDFTGDVDKVVTDHLSSAQKNVNGWKGTTPLPIAEGEAYIADDANLKNLSLALLEAEINRLTSLISADATTAQRFNAISQKIALEQAALTGLKEKLEDYEGAQSRVETLRLERDITYGRVFTSIVEEESILKDLYQPIMTKLSESTGTLHKMSFSIKRTVNIDRWAEEGERLFDLRVDSAFRGRGTLKQHAQDALLPAWENGSDADVVAAMKKFQDDHANELIANATVAKTDKENFRAWAMLFAKWLYGTSHISLIYGVDYDGVDIRKLSPGTRGIVLLMLYLELDNDDDRPLIIDQPEENLDPKSIYDELVSLFISAKQKRQVIMVTHNANLVVNTDADQIIIAKTGERLPSGMPKISYMSGGLEEAHIREEVCGILEGGEPAFRRRAERLRVNIQ
jgi:ABC-type lipoprotein export system ATPase subunit